MLGQTITVVNQSGKVVSTSKQLVNVFKEAKAAYRERKAEIYHARQAEHEQLQAQHALKYLDIDDHEPVHRVSSGRSGPPYRPHASRSRGARQARKPPVGRGYTDSFYVNDVEAKLGKRRTPSSGLHGPRDGSLVSPRRSATTPMHKDDLALAYGEDHQRQELIRRHSESPVFSSPRKDRRRMLDDIDMDLAYGELPPPLPVRRLDEETELRTRVTKLQHLLDEANCLQHTATLTIENLQKNPEALAAVGLALAEISSLATKMAPGMLTAMKGSFPAIFALLASPQFLIAAGVGVGITVVMLGGYKVIKRLKDKKELDQETPFINGDELQELDPELSHVERWRRGISEADAESVGTSVDGEFITPVASRRLIEEGALNAEDLRSSKSGKARMKRKMDGASTTRRAKSTISKATGSRPEKDQAKKKTGKESHRLGNLFTSSKAR